LGNGLEFDFNGLPPYLPPRPLTLISCKDEQLDVSSIVENASN